MRIEIGLTKVGKYAVRESGDSVEIVERPRGGLSVIIVDGQGHGRSAKRISHAVCSKAAALIGDGARDGAVMRAVSDYLFALRDGKVSATVSILTADLAEKCLVISRNSNSPVIIRHQDGSSCLDAEVNPIGVHRSNRPAVSHWPLYPGTLVVGFTDGVTQAGRRGGDYQFSLDYALQMIGEQSEIDPQAVADHLLDYALRAEQRKPRDDMAVAALAIQDVDRDLGIRKMMVQYPF